MKKSQLSNLLRKLHLIYYTDQVRFYLQKFKNRRINQDFRNKNPQVKLPPDYLIYESFQINYQKYYAGGLESARWLAGHLERHIKLQNIRILDWGCGPGRVIRHLPMVVGGGCEFYGTDYNAKSIEWCTQNLTGISFNNNSLEARLPYADNFFDVVYGISIFTHLSEPMHYGWYNELSRVLKPGGLFFLTTQGDNFKCKLTEAESADYNKGQLIVRGKVKEGHRTFSAFHPKSFMLKLFCNAEIVEHIETPPQNQQWIPQDIWMVRKN